MTWKNRCLSALLAIGLIVSITTAAWTQESSSAIRYPIPNSDFPISQAVEIPSTGKLIYLSGQVPSITDETADANSVLAFGNTETQTVNVLQKIDSILQGLDLTMGDVVKMQAFLVGDPTMEDKMDFAGFMAGYTQFFGTAEQPNLPSRSAMQVAGLVNPGWLVEIEVVALRE